MDIVISLKNSYSVDYQWSRVYVTNRCVAKTKVSLFERAFLHHFHHINLLDLHPVPFSPHNAEMKSLLFQSDDTPCSSIVQHEVTPCSVESITALEFRYVAVPCHERSSKVLEYMDFTFPSSQLTNAVGFECFRNHPQRPPSTMSAIRRKRIPNS